MRFGVCQPDSSDEEESAFVVVDTPSPTKPGGSNRKGSRFSAPLLTGDSSGSESSLDSSASYSSDEEYAYEEAKAAIVLARGKGKARSSLVQVPLTPTPAPPRKRQSSDSNHSDNGSGSRDSGKGKGKARSGDELKPGMTGSRRGKQGVSGERPMDAKLAVAMDEWEAWEMASKQTALIRAHTAAEAFRASISPSSPHRQPPRPIRGFQNMALLKDQQAARELDDIRSMLEGMDIKRAEEDRRAQEDFEKRNRELWANIEASIRAANQAEARRQAEIKQQRDKEEALRARLRKEAEDKAKKEKEEQDRKAADLAAKKDAVKKAQEARQAAERARVAEEAARAREEQDRAAGAGLLRGLGKKRAEWTGWTEKHKAIKADVIETTKADATIKRSVARPRNAIRSKIGQCTNSREKIVSVIGDIHNVLQATLGGFEPVNTQQPMTLERNPSVAYRYLLTQTSKFLIKQAEEEVQPNPDAAYKLAKVAVGLMITGHVMLGEILMARLVKKCCFVVPYYPAQVQGQPEDEYRKSVGQKLGQAEDEVQFALRMSAILRFYLAILGTDLRRMSSVIAGVELQNYAGLDSFIHPCFRLGAGWSWLTGILRDPMPGYDPTPQLLIAALETIGQELTFAYGEREMGKVMMVILTKGLGMNMATGQQEAVGELAPQNNSAREQLKILLGPLIEHGRFDPVPAKQWEE